MIIATGAQRANSIWSVF